MVSSVTSGDGSVAGAVSSDAAVVDEAAPSSDVSPDVQAAPRSGRRR